MTTFAIIVMAAVLGGEPSTPIITPTQAPPPQFGITVVDEKLRPAKPARQPGCTPPRFGIAVMDARGGIEIRYSESVASWEPRRGTRLPHFREGDKGPVEPEATTYAVRVQETKLALETRAGDQFSVFRNSAELGAKACAELLTQPRRVVFMEATRPGSPAWPDEFYLDLLSEQTVVVLLTPLTTPEIAVDPTKDRRVNICRIVAFRSAKAAFFRGAKGDTYFCAGPKPPLASKLPGASAGPAEVSPPAAKPLAAPPPGRAGRGDRYRWEESLAVVRDAGRGPNVLLLLLHDSHLEAVYVYFRGRPDVTPKEGWRGPQLIRSGDGELTWFGHHGSDDTRGSARISFGPYYLSIVDATTAPQLVLTADADKASFWSLATEKTLSRDPDDESHEERSTGYIQATGVPGVRLWLAISSRPILQTQLQMVGRDMKDATVECRLLTVSPKKECLFEYVRGWATPN